MRASHSLLLLMFTATACGGGRIRPVTGRADPLLRAISVNADLAITAKEFVAADAMRLASVRCRDGVSAKHVHAARNDFAMPGVDAAAVSAQVVNLQSFGNGADEVLVREPVDTYRPFIDPGDGISIFSTPWPRPADSGVARRMEEIESPKDVHSSHAVTWHGSIIGTAS